MSAGAAQCQAPDEFYEALYALTKCPDGQTQLKALSDVCQTARSDLSTSTEPSVRQHEVRLLFEVLMQPYSASLHRPLLAALRPLIASEALRQASAVAITQCINEQQRQWRFRTHQETPMTCIPLSAAWTNITSCISVSKIPVHTTCVALHLLSEQMHCVLEQAQNVAAPMQGGLAHDLKVCIHAAVVLELCIVR